MPERVKGDASRRARIEEIVLAGRRDALWSCWDEAAPDPASAFAAAYPALMRWARIDPPTALRVIESLRKHGSRDLDAVGRARLVRLHGHALRANGRFREAAANYADATRRFRDLGDEDEVVRTAIGRVDVLSMLDEVDEALGVGRESRRRLARVDPVLAARLKTNLGALHHRTGRPERAVTAYRDARRVLRRAGLEADAALVDFNLGQSLDRLGRLGDAERAFRRAHEIFAARGFDAQALRARFALATIRLRRGRGDEGFPELRALGAELEDAGDTQAVAALRWELSRVWGAFGDLDRALEDARAAAGTYRALGMGRDAAHVATIAATWLRRRGRRSDARFELERAHEVFTRLGDHTMLRRLDVDLAALDLENGAVDGAADRLTRAQRGLDRTDRESALRCRILLAEIDLRRDRPGAALRRLRRARDTTRAAWARAERPAIALLLARAHAARGDDAAAVRWAKRTVADLDAMAGGIGDEVLRRTLRTGRMDLVREAVELVLSRGRRHAERDALDLLVLARSRELVEALIDEVPGLSRETRARIALLRQELLETGDDGREDVRVRVIRRDIERLDGELHRRVARRFGIARRASDTRQVSRWRDRLGDDTAVVFESVGGRWCAFVARTGHVRRVVLDLDDAGLRALWHPLQLLFEAAAGMPAARRRDFLERTRREAYDRLRALGDALWSPLDLPAGRVHLVLPDAMHEMPIEAAGALMADGGARVASRWPHPALIRTDVPRRRGTAVLLHDGTDARRAEVQAIARLLRRREMHTVQGKDRRRLDDANTIGLFHVAAHGAVSRGHWIGTGIRLEDGWLGLEEIAEDRRYRDGTLFFASCASGQQSARPQGRLDGWTSAGLGSGAREIVMALWKIDDRVSARFTRSFYAHWAAGASAAEAAARTRANAIAQDQHPYGWAPFGVVG